MPNDLRRIGCPGGFKEWVFSSRQPRTVGRLAAVVGSVCCLGCVDPVIEHPWELNEARTFESGPQRAVPLRVDRGIFSVVVPLGIERSKIALSASDGLSLGDGAVVIHATDGHSLKQYGVVAARGAVELGRGVEVGSVYALGHAPTRLGAEAKIHGYVKASDSVAQDATTRVSVGIMTNAPSSVERFSWPVRFNQNSGSDIISSASDAMRRDLAPGSYNSLSIGSGGAAVIHGGHYYLGSLHVADGGSLEIDNLDEPVFVWVRDSLELMGSVQSYQLVPNTLIGYAGVLPPIIRTGLRTTLVAPYAELRLPATREPHRGQFFARSLVIESGATVEQEAFVTRTRPGHEPEVVCGTCALAARAAARECCRAWRRELSQSVVSIEACRARCSIEQGESNVVCSAHCAGDLSASKIPVRTRLQQCMQTGPLSIYGRCQQQHGYRPGVCESIGKAAPVLDDCAM